MLASEWKQDILSGKMDDTFRHLYQNDSAPEAQKERWAALADRFIELYGDKEAIFVTAAGRTEVSGNHTDHQHGRVLAASVNLDTIALAAPTEDGMVKLVSDDYDIPAVDLAQLEPDSAEYGTSQSLIRGVAAALKEAGHKTGGFEAAATSSVLAGAGLSSSASFEILVGNIFSGLYNDGKLDPVFLAKAGQKAENVFFGKPCGLMDQCACSVGGLVTIDFQDPENPDVRAVDTDFGKFNRTLCIVDTKGSHADLTDEYAAMPAEMKKIAQAMGKDVLRDVEYADFLAQLPALREACGDRAVLRAFHFFQENDRVPQIVTALENDDFDGFRKGITASGNSSWKLGQNISVASRPEQQPVAVALAVSDSVSGDHGFCRVHGGGFAGTIQAFVDDDFVDTYRKGMDAVFGDGACHVLKIRPVGGAVLYGTENQ